MKIKIVGFRAGQAALGTEKTVECDFELLDDRLAKEKLWGLLGLDFAKAFLDSDVVIAWRVDE